MQAGVEASRVGPPYVEAVKPAGGAGVGGVAVLLLFLGSDVENLMRTSRAVEPSLSGAWMTAAATRQTVWQTTQEWQTEATQPVSYHPAQARLIAAQ